MRLVLRSTPQGFRLAHESTGELVDNVERLDYHWSGNTNHEQCTVILSGIGINTQPDTIPNRFDGVNFHPSNDTMRGILRETQANLNSALSDMMAPTGQRFFDPPSGFSGFSGTSGSTVGFSGFSGRDPSEVAARRPEAEQAPQPPGPETSLPEPAAPEAEDTRWDLI